MDGQIVAIFCLCDDMLKALHHHEDPQCVMSDAEVMTTAIVACFTFAATLHKKCGGSACKRYRRLNLSLP